jgi:hypothetical protein
MSAQPPNNNYVDDELRGLWQGQRLEGEKMSLDEIRRKVRTFEKHIRVRNVIEYIAAAIVIVSFGNQIFRPTPDNVVTRIAAGLVILATLYVVYTLHTRGSVKPIPDTMGGAPVIEFYRSSLERQQNLLENVWRWYLLPFVPAQIAMLISFAIRDGLILNPAPSPDAVRDGVFLLLFAVVLTAFFFLVIAWNKRNARKLQSEIDALELR